MRLRLALLLRLSFLLVAVVVIAAQSEKNKTVISHLPGFHGPLPFSLQTGYVEVDSSNGVRLFYYFVESERSPAEDPVLLWLTGGPGCSAFSGLVYEIGNCLIDQPSLTIYHACILHIHVYQCIMV